MLHHEKNNMQFSKILGEGNGRFSVWQISFLSGTQCFPIKDKSKIFTSKNRNWYFPTQYVGVSKFIFYIPEMQRKNACYISYPLTFKIRQSLNQCIPKLQIIS